MVLREGGNGEWGERATGTPLPGWPREPSTCFPLGLTLLVNEGRGQYSYPWSDPQWAWPLCKSDLPPSPSQHGSLPGQPLPRVPSALPSQGSGALGTVGLHTLLAHTLGIGSVGAHPGYGNPSCSRTHLVKHLVRPCGPDRVIGALESLRSLACLCTGGVWVGRRNPQPRCREWGAAPTNSSARSRPRRDSVSESTSSDLCQTASTALSPAGPRPPRDPYCPPSSCFTPPQKPSYSRGTAFRADPRAARGIPRLRPAH